MKRLRLLFVSILIFISMSGFTSPAHGALQETASTSEELVSWLKEHAQTQGTILLTDNITLPKSFHYAYKGSAALTIDTGAFTLSTSGNESIFQGGLDTDGALIIRGEGVNGPVLQSGRQELSLFNRITIAAYGRDGAGGTAVEAGHVGLVGGVRVSSEGQGAKGILAGGIYAKDCEILTKGNNSTALHLDAEQWNTAEISNELRDCTIRATGINAESILGSKSVIQSMKVSNSKIDPEVDFGSQIIDWTPAQNWNRRTILISPEENYQMPDSVQIFVQSATGGSEEALISLDWPEELPDFTVPGSYSIEGTVTASQFSQLKGAAFTLTVCVGTDFSPVLNAPMPYMSLKGKLFTLNFPSSRPDGAQNNTKLWISDDDGASWTNNESNSSLYVQNLIPEKPYLLVAEAEKDSIMQGKSTVYELTVHNDETFTFAATDRASPEDFPLEPLPTVSSWKEMASLIDNPDRTQTEFALNCDLTVEDYIDINSNTGSLAFDLNMGSQSITVKDGGWLLLSIPHIKGEGVKKPLITVESGGTLVLENTGYLQPGSDSMEIRAEGNGDIGGVAVDLKDGAKLYTQKSPKLSAYGTGAVALRSNGTDLFALPTGMKLYAEGEGAVALETAGAVDILYTEVSAKGNGSQAVKCPAKSDITLISAKADPIPENAVIQNGVFRGFSEDMKEPYKLWMGRFSGMYLSNVPKYASLSFVRNGVERTEPILVDCEWDDSKVNYMKAGSYTSKVAFSSQFGTIDGMMESMEVEVGIMEAGTKPDISVTHPIPPISVGGQEASYGFTIWCNDFFTPEIATLWCSDDDGKTWKKADDVFDVFWVGTEKTQSASIIQVTGLTPETPYLFRLTSKGKETQEESIMAGTSDIRQIILDSDGKITNIDWSGDRDGGDSQGDPRPEIVQPSPKPIDSNHLKTSKDKSGGYFDQSKLKNKSADETAGGLAEDKDPLMEYFGQTKDVISGTRLLMMLESTGQAQFSKQGVTVVFAAEPLKKLNIQNDDKISIVIKKSKENTVSFSFAVNHIPVTRLPGTQLKMPYSIKAEGGQLYLTDKNQKRIAEGNYDSQLAVASFILDTTGRFTIIEDSAEVQAVAKTSVSQEPSIPIWPALLIIILLLMAVCGFSFFKRRKRI